jgi:hypothetical protein
MRMRLSEAFHPPAHLSRASRWRWTAGYLVGYLFGWVHGCLEGLIATAWKKGGGGDTG